MVETTKKRVTVELTPEQHKDLKLISVQTGRTLKDLFAEAVDRIRADHRQEIETASGKV